MKLLQIDSSITGENSVSRLLTSEIVTAQVRLHAGLEVTYRDLAAEPLPHFTIPNAADASASIGNLVLEEFLSADIIVIGAPMYNFAIPSQLKAWIDRLVVSGKNLQIRR